VVERLFSYGTLRQPEVQREYEVDDYVRIAVTRASADER
jgi:hypothetical protein